MNYRAALLLAVFLPAIVACSEPTEPGATPATASDPDPVIGDWVDDLRTLVRNLGGGGLTKALPPQQREVLREQARRYSYEFLLDADGHALRRSVGSPSLAPEPGRWHREGDRIIVTLDEGARRIEFVHEGDVLRGQHPELRVERRLRRGRAARTTRR